MISLAPKTNSPPEGEKKQYIDCAVLALLVIEGYELIIKETVNIVYTFLAMGCIFIDSGTAAQLDTPLQTTPVHNIPRGLGMVWMRRQSNGRPGTCHTTWCDLSIGLIVMAAMWMLSFTRATRPDHVIRLSYRICGIANEWELMIKWRHDLSG
jgi:hypothetical protein